MKISKERATQPNAVDIRLNRAYRPVGKHGNTLLWNEKLHWLYLMVYRQVDRSAIGGISFVWIKVRDCNPKGKYYPSISWLVGGMATDDRHTI